MPLRARLVNGAHHGIISAVAGIIAYVPTRALGLNEGFWSAVTAIGVVQAELHATQTTARDQLLGAAIGGLAALAFCVYVVQTFRSAVQLASRSAPHPSKSAIADLRVRT